VPPVSPDTVYTRTLRRALETLGGVEQLAAALEVSVLEVEAWLGGLEPPPGAFLRAIDIVAHGGFGRA
jgi:DNA-binding transcriptional regulator YiaG